MSALGFMLGALLITFLVSRCALLLLRFRHKGGGVRLFAAHLISFIVVTVIGGVGMADGGAFAGAKAATLYVLPQIFWLIVDLIRQWLRSRRKSQPEY
jgi:hypothetical protein